MTIPGRILAGFIWALIIVAALGLSAAHIPPTTFWPLAVLGVFLPGVCLLLLVTIPVSIYFKRWPAAVAAAVIVLVVGWRYMSFERFDRPQASDEDLVLMSYNAPKEPDEDWARTRVTEMIGEVRPDIIALQESVVWSVKSSPDVLRTHRKFQLVVDSLGYHVKMPPEGGPPNVRWTHWRPPVLLNFVPDDQDQLETKGPDGSASEFSVLRTEITWSGRRLAVYNIHLSSHGSSKPWRKPGGVYSPAAWIDYLREIKRGFDIREWQTEYVRKLVSEEELPVVLVGDFNSTPDSWTYARLSDGLQDAYRASGSRWGSTYHSRRPLVRIDFVLLGPEFEPVDAFVVDDYPRSSDHRPLAVRFRWR